MAKLIEYNIEGVEESGGGTGVKAKPGVYVARIERITQRTENRNGDPANDLEVVLNLGDEYDWLWTYVGLSEAAEWKLAEFIRALNLKEKGKFDPDKLKHKLIRIKVNPGTYGGNYRPEAGRFMKLQKGDTFGDATGVSDNGASASGAGDGDDEPITDGPTAVAEALDRLPEWADDFEPTREDADDPEVGEYEQWAESDVAAELEDRKLTVAGGRGKKIDKMLAALRADDEDFTNGTGAYAGEATDEDEPEAEAETAEAEDNYDELDLDALKAEWDARQMGDYPDIKGRNAAARLTAAIIEALRADDAENPFEG